MSRLLEERRKGRLASEYGEGWAPVPNGLRIALIYPNTYRVGMSNLGFQTIYHLLNQRNDVTCERVFLLDREKREKAGNSPKVYRSLESGSLLKDFDVLAFSVSFELDYIHLVEILTGARIPPLFCDRAAEQNPQVWIGGVGVTLNPEPLADFADLIFIGEAEELLTECLDALSPLSGRGLPPVEEMFPFLRDVDGVYFPNAYTPQYDPVGKLDRIEARDGYPEKTRRRWIRDVDRFPTVSRILTPETELNDMFLVELDRGCGRHCRFCAAGYLYRPPRFRSLKSVLHSIRDGLALSDRIGLVGTAVSDYPRMDDLLEELGKKRARISVSSLRADSLTTGLVDALVASGQKTLTLAPEGGSQKMRDRMNKQLSEETILGACSLALSSGIPNLRLYFMVGLPFEEEADIEAIVDLVKKIRKIQLAAGKVRGRIGRITVDINCFVPKPITPFQWVPMNKKDALSHKIGYIKKNLRREGNISVLHDLPKWAIIQGILSRGDRRLSSVLLTVVKSRGNWSQVLRQDRLGVKEWPFRTRDQKELFPWDVVKAGCRKRYLWQEYNRTASGSSTRPCPEDLDCRRCGVCGDDSPTERRG